MADKKKNTHVYQSTVAALPPLKLVLGEIPTPDGEDQPFLPAAGRQKAKSISHSTLTKLIGHLKDDEK